MSFLLEYELLEPLSNGAKRLGDENYFNLLEVNTIEWILAKYRYNPIERISFWHPLYSIWQFVSKILPIPSNPSKGIEFFRVLCLFLSHCALVISVISQTDRRNICVTMFCGKKTKQISEWMLDKITEIFMGQLLQFLETNPKYLRIMIAW